MIYAGDEVYGDEVTSPELEVRDDLLPYPCEDCGAEAGEECRRHCPARQGGPH